MISWLLPCLGEVIKLVSLFCLSVKKKRKGRKAKTGKADGKPQRQKHEKTAIVKVFCPYCEFSSEHAQSLRRHCRNIHNVSTTHPKVQQATKGWYVKKRCNYCGGEKKHSTHWSTCKVRLAEEARKKSAKERLAKNLPPLPEPPLEQVKHGFS